MRGRQRHRQSRNDRQGGKPDAVGDIRFDASDRPANLERHAVHLISGARVKRRFPNRGVPDDVGEFLVSIDEIEELSGFDFLPDMEDGLEDALEEQIGDPQTCPVCRPG